MSFVLLWGLVDAIFGQWVPVLVAGVLGLGLVRADRVDLPRRTPARRAS